MRRILIAVGALISFASAMCGTRAVAQNTAVNAAVWPHGAADISRGWSLHQGDDPAYAEPGYDDSSWQKVDLHPDPLPSEVVSQGNARWYRLRLRLPDDPRKVQLLLTGTLNSYEVYVNGRRTGTGIRSSRFWVPRRPTVYDLPGVAPGEELVVAVRSHSYPAVLLATLNQRVYGRMSSGFATCAALHLLPDGTAVLASAANPAPYLNGQELELPGALPLGMLAEVEYRNHPLKLHGGDILTFVSDGIVEAAGSNGKELFGFDRTRAMSRNSAIEQAQAARAFGQNDDITVLRVSMLADAAE